MKRKNKKKRGVRNAEKRKRPRGHSLLLFLFILEGRRRCWFANQRSRILINGRGVSSVGNSGAQTAIYGLPKTHMYTANSTQNEAIKVRCARSRSADMKSRRYRCIEKKGFSVSITSQYQSFDGLFFLRAMQTASKPSIAGSDMKAY